MCDNVSTNEIKKKQKNMIKKLFSFIFCLAPVGAMAAPTELKPVDANGIINITDNTLHLTTADNSVVVTNGTTSGGDPVTARGITVDANGIDVAGGLIVGRNAGTETGWVFILNNTAAGDMTNGFSIVSAGPIKIGEMLQVENGNYLKLGQTGGATTDLTVGSIDNSGRLDLTNIGAFATTGTIRNNTGAVSLDINAVSMSTASIENTSGTMILGHKDASGNIIMTGGLDTNGGTITSSGAATRTDIIAETLTADKIQNNAGIMNIELGGNLTSTGVIENKGGESFTISTNTDITVTGAMTNEGGEMVITAKNLTVNGTDAEHKNASFVNSGNLTLDIGGALTLANGFDTSAMNINNTFNLTTGTLDVGGNDNWLQLFSNKLNQFNVTVRNGNLALATDIVNGQSDSISNENANMNITAQDIAANSVTNTGNALNITAAGTGTSNGNINIANGVTGNTGTTTLAAVRELTIGGAVTNMAGATMKLSGEGGTTIESVTNSGDMQITSVTGATGFVTVNGTVTNNSGNMLIESREIDIAGTITNNGGTMTIRGSDQNSGAVNLGAITAAGGTINLNSLIGPIAVNGNMHVTNGTMNIGLATTDITVDGETLVNGDVILSATPALAAGSLTIGGAGVQNFKLNAANGIDIRGDINATQGDFSRTAQFVAGNNIINVGGDVSAAGGGSLIFGNSTANTTTIAGDATANGTGTLEFYGNQTTVGSLSGTGKIVSHGGQITATNGDINIANTIWFNNPTTDPASGLIVKDANNLTLATQIGDITAAGIDLAAGNTLNLTSARNVIIDGTVTDSGTLNITSAQNTTLTRDITVASGTGSLNIDAASINMADLTNNNIAKLVATNISAGALNATGGLMSISGDLLTANLLTVSSGATATIDVGTTVISGPVAVTGNMTQGASATGLNITKDGRFMGDSLNVTGNFDAQSGSVDYVFNNTVRIAGNLTTNSGADTDITAGGKFTTTNIDSNGTLRIAAGTGIDAAQISSSGSLVLDSGTGFINASDVNFGGTTALAGQGLTTAGTFNQNVLRQNYAGALGARDVNVMANNYTITASSVTLGAFAQESGTMTLRTSDLTVGGNIDATNLYVKANPSTNWLNVGVSGSVSGDVKFVGLEHMSIGGNYTYNSDSGLNMAILPYATGPGSTAYDYWANVSLKDDNTLGQITHDGHLNPEPLISVNGTFITNLNSNLSTSTGLLADGQMGVQIFDMINQGTAIWLLHAEGGIREEGSKIRNITVKFCNADGSKCFDYFKPAPGLNETGTDLPAYITVRDYNGDGTADSLYLVFDPRFGGPVEVFKIQPIVGREDGHTKGEYVTAGALDDLIAGGLADAKFHNRTPIEAIPVAFAGTNMEEMSKELFKRMEYYTTSRDGHGLARFSRLFQPREIEQFAGNIVLNEHTSFRDFEDHMLDEFIWNRNRNLRKAWGEFDFGMVRQNVADGKHASSNRFSFTGGYDWQETETLILGLAGRVSHTSGDNEDNIDLGYLPGQSIAGHVNVDVSDTNFGIGAYLLQTLGTKMRAYGNAFLDLHWLDVTRDQTYMSKIEGDGTSFSLISEWGLMHDWLNQYIVGNVYARVGYNFGFSVSEKAGGDDYMKLESDGYLVLTPGYSLIAQKRIYPSPWFQMRPYASIGVEYDVLGAPDNAKYKFAAAKRFTKYDIEIDPLWANIGGGIEFLSATGVQVGLDYRYQYNADIQMHKIKLSGSYRF